MAKTHDRYLELVFVADDSAESVAVSEVNYYRTPSDTKYALKFTQDAALTTGTKLAFGELCPPPTHILLTFTVVA
jgi:hypothetical protein